MESVSFWAAVTFYALASVAFFVATAFHQRRATAVGFVLSVVAALPHVAALALRWASVGHGPYSTRYEVISANVLLLVATYALTGAFVPRLRGLGLFVLPVAFLAMGWAVSTFELEYEVPIIFKSYWLFLHIGFAKLFGATALLAGSCAGAHLIKIRRPPALPRLPSPARLELYAHQFLLASFFFLGVMIIAGSLWAHQSWGRYWGWDAIETSALVTWLVFALVLHLRVLHHWSGERMAWLTLVALAAALTTAYLVALIVPTIHNAYLVGQ